MLYLVKLFPEITIKSRPVRRRMTRQLRKNIRAVLVQYDPGISVSGEWDSIEVETAQSEPALLARIRERLAVTPGISLFQEVVKYDLPDFEGILELARAHYGEQLPDRTFAVRCKRTGRHDFRSVDVERYVGAGLDLAYASARVRLKQPDVTVAMEIRHESLYIIESVSQGLGGFPLGAQDAVLSLISGGFDSSVSSYLCIRRGLQTHYCFFSLGGRAHELAVKEVALYLWMKFHSSHRVKFVTVPFEEVVAEILRRVDNAQMGVVLKRAMLRAASRVAASLDIDALVTGESVAQVSSQTLANLAAIDSATDTLVLRPLATSDKQEIIDSARKIGTEEFSRNIPEYCSVISRNPATRVRPERVAREEARLAPDLIDEAVANARYQLITEVMDAGESMPAPVEVVASADAAATVIDIRHPDEIELSPFKSTPEAAVLAIPFYQLRTRMNDFNSDARLLLYCDRGMMSRLHAAHLQDQGFSNVAVLDPTTPS